MSYSEYYNGGYRKPEGEAYKPTKCPRCGQWIALKSSFIHPRLGRSRWCRHCKVLFNHEGIILDVMAWYDKEYLDEDK